MRDNSFTQLLVQNFPSMRIPRLRIMTAIAMMTAARKIHRKSDAKAVRDSFLIDIYNSQFHDFYSLNLQKNRLLHIDKPSSSRKQTYANSQKAKNRKLYGFTKNQYVKNGKECALQTRQSAIPLKLLLVLYSIFFFRLFCRIPSFKTASQVTCNATHSRNIFTLARWAS